MKATNAPPAIIMRGIKKKYQIGAFSSRTLQADLQSRWAKIRRREDPNTKIGSQERLIGTTFYALNGIDLTIYQGETIGIIGANGAGKSTLLKLLSHLTAPTEGEIDLYGRITSMLEVGTGFHREMTGRENIYMNGAILGMTKKEIDARLDEIIAFSEIADFIDTPVKRYSSGMVTKLAFSVAAHLNSEIMIMDEVLAVGDMAFQSKCLDKMREAAQVEGRTVLYVSHNMHTIRRLCSRCIVLDEGRIIYDGDVEEAIGLYLSQNASQNAVDIDLAVKPRSNRHLKQTTLMMRLLLLDKDLPKYDRNEVLKLRLMIQHDRPSADVMLRMTFRTESDIGIGTTWSQPFSLPTAGTDTKDFAFPLQNIVKGRFYVSIGLYRIQPGGQKIMLDHITRAFKIELTEEPNWQTNAHGYIALPTTEMI